VHRFSENTSDRLWHTDELEERNVAELFECARMLFCTGRQGLNL
jgi:hypothetical protein